jgi:hypothetical protein
MKSSAFNAQGSRVIIVVVQVGAVKIYVVGVVDGGAQVKRKEGVKTSLRLSLPQKEKENLKFSPFFLVKFTPFLRASDYMQIKFECVCLTYYDIFWKKIV